MNSTQHTDFMLRYAEDLFEHCRSLFAKLLVTASADDAEWKKRTDSFSKLGLLSYRLPSPFTPKALNVDESKLEDSRYRRWLIRKLKAPRPSKFVNVTVRIDRSRLNDSTYLGEMTTLLAYKWVGLVIDDSDSVVRFLLLKLTDATLARSLDKFGLHQISGHNVAQELLRATAEEALENCDTLKRCEADIRRAGQEALSTLKANMEPVIAQTLADFDRDTKVWMTEINARADEAIARIRADHQASAERTAQVLAATRDDEDPEVAFRNAVKRHEEEYRASITPAEKWTWRIVGFGFFTLVAFFVEIEGVTPAKALVDLLPWLF